MACSERLAWRLAPCLCAAAWLAPAVQAQVPAGRAADPAAALMAPASGAPPGPAAAPLPGRWNLAQLQQSFLLADSNADRQLTRAEAQRLAILPRSFEDLDANRDGVLTAQEYQAGAS